MTDIGGIPVVQTGNGFGEGGGLAWVLVIFALLGRGGFGGFGGLGGGCEPNWARSNEMESRFNALQSQIDFNANAGFQRDILSRVDQSVFATQAVGARIDHSLMENRFIGAAESAATRAEIGRIGCETNRNIDGVRFQNERDTCAIINAGHKDTDRVLDYLVQKDLREKDMALSEARIIAAMLPPRAVPAYISANPYENYTPTVNCRPNHCGGGFNNCGTFA